MTPSAQLQEGLEDHTKRFLVERYASLRTSIFHSLSPAALDAVANRAQIRFVKAGDVVYRAGDAASTFFVVAHGKLQRDYHGRNSKPEGGNGEGEGPWPTIWGGTSSFNNAAPQQSGGDPLFAADLDEDEGRTAPSQLLRVGSYFGEVGLLLPSTVMLATVSANVDSTLLALDKNDFFECIGGLLPVLFTNLSQAGALCRFPRKRRG